MSSSSRSSHDTLRPKLLLSPRMQSDLALPCLRAVPRQEYRQIIVIWAVLQSLIRPKVHLSPSSPARRVTDRPLPCQSPTTRAKLLASPSSNANPKRKRTMQRSQGVNLLRRRSSLNTNPRRADCLFQALANSKRARNRGAPRILKSLQMKPSTAIASRHLLLAEDRDLPSDATVLPLAQPANKITVALA